MHSESIHLVSQRPKIDGLYAVISAATCPDFSALYLVLSFYVPNNVVVLGVREGGRHGGFLWAFTAEGHPSP